MTITEVAIRKFVGKPVNRRLRTDEKNGEDGGPQGVNPTEPYTPSRAGIREMVGASSRRDDITAELASVARDAPTSSH